MLRSVLRVSTKIATTIFDRKIIITADSFNATSQNSICNSPKPIFTTRIAVPTDYDFILQFMSKTYFKSEPSMVNCGLARKDPSPLLLTTMKQQIKQGMTIIALGDDGCVIGAAINSSVTPLDPKNIRKLSKCAENRAVANIMIYFAYIVELPRLWITHDISKYFECSMIAVDPDYQGFGIAKKLAHDSWLLARDCGFTLFRIDCSSKYTARIAEKFGWTSVASVPFKSYANDCGEFIFQYIVLPHDVMEVFINFPFNSVGQKK